MTNPKLWKVACQEDVYPGMWQRWYRNQCVAVGWPAKRLSDRTVGDRGWSAARNAIEEMQPGDYVVVALRGNRVGRLGQITGKAINDDEWNPLVPRGLGLPDGEMGRRILVRWHLTVGPDNSDLVVQLPTGSTFSRSELRPTVSRIQSTSLDALQKQMNDPANWVSLLGNFKYEKALSDYIANYPNRLEDGFLPHPNSKIRELVFRDNTRLDVLLIDKNNVPVIVECKQYAPIEQDLLQLRHYMRLFQEKTGAMPRGMLVHGGAAKLHKAIAVAAKQKPVVEIVNYSLEVNFKSSLH
jgi:hypothetical protein